MKSIPLLVLLAASARADLFVTNFTALNSTEATGVWRNETTATDLAIPVSLSQSGGTIQPADGSSTASIINNTGGEIYNLWEDVPSFPPVTPGIDVFEPNFIGDYINIETQQDTTTTVTLDFGATITDPVISFTDVEYRSTITFPSPLTKLAGTSNLQVTGNSLTSDKSTAAGDPGVFEQEAAGSVQLTGNYDSIVFTVTVAIGDGTVGVNDRTGYVVSTMTAPQPAGTGTPPELSVQQSGNQILLAWPVGEFDSIEMTGSGLSGWTAIPGLDPGAVGMWTGELSTLGGTHFFRGIYTP